MVGTLDETHLNEIREQENDEQESIFAFTGDDKHTATRIAVVSKPGDTGVLDVCDEYRPELGMPLPVLTDFQKLRGQLNGFNDIKNHNQAYEECDLDHTYREYVRSDEEASEAVEEIATRLQDGENITLVCFERSPKKCHRHTLKEIIEQRLEVAQ